MHWSRIWQKIYCLEEWSMLKKVSLLAFKVAVVFSLFAVMLVMTLAGGGMEAAAAGTGTYLINDDFESDTLGEIPEGWIMKYYGDGESKQGVVDEVSKTGSNSFKLDGRNSWSATFYKQINDIPNVITIEAYMRPASTGESGSISLFNKEGGTWGEYLARVVFGSEQISYSKTGHDENDLVNLQSYTVDTWYHIKIVHDLNTRTYDVYIDGVNKASGVAMKSGNDPDSLVVSSGNGSGSNIIYYDDVKVYSGDESPNSDATLSDLAVDGTTVDGFDPGIMSYDVELPAGTTAVPTVTATVYDTGKAIAEVTSAESLPGTTTVLVTAEDGITTKTYSINFTVAEDTTPPELTAGAVNRTSDTEATVKFTSTEAGEYYYQVVDESDAAPTIDASGAGIACDTTEQTITNPVGLTAGAKDIYIVVKDGAGNVSEPLKISIEQYKEFAGGTGTEADPYQIETAEQLGNVRNHLVGKYFVLIGDIDLGGTNWIPIGPNYNAPFNGTFDGNGYAITGLTTNTASEYQGLFGYTSAATLDNIRLINIDIEAGRYSGGLVGASSYYTTIRNCYTTGSIVSTGNRVGGLVGDMFYGSIIFNSYSRATVTGSNEVGGLVGQMNGSSGRVGLSNSYSAGTVSGTYSSVGGAVGNTYSNVSISNVYWNSDVNLTGIGSDQSGVDDITGMTTAQMQETAFADTLNANKTFWDLAWAIIMDENDGYPTFAPPDITAPTLAAGEVMRLSDTEATVKFSSDEAGQYYYAVVEDGAGEPEIDTSGAGTVCDTSEQTININGIMAGAKDIYIKVKDEGSNVSAALKIDVLAYVAPVTDVQKVAADKDALTWDDIKNANIDSDNVTTDLNLITTGTVYGSSISWTSSDTDIMTVTGHVYRPSYSAGDKEVTLAATITNGEAEDTDKFYITVIKQPQTDAEAVAQDTQALEIGYTVGDSANSVTDNLTFPTTGANGSTISWLSGNTAVISNTGEVTRPAYSDGDADVTVTASVYKSGVSDSKTFNMTVLKSAPSSSGSSSSRTKTKPEPEVAVYQITKAQNITTGVEITLSTSDSISTAAVAEDVMDALIAKAISEQAAARDDSIEIKVTAAEAAAAKVTIPQASFAKISDRTEAGVQITAPMAMVRFDERAIETINEAAEGEDSVSIFAGKVDMVKLSDQDKEKVKDRPVYEFAVKAGSTPVSDFGSGHAMVTIPYTLKQGENPQSVVIYYLADDGSLKTVRGHYDRTTNTVRFRTSHFSKFIVGYNMVSFQDVSLDAWYRDAVRFIAARGITTGTGDGSYSPEEKLTRGQFLVMMMRAYAIDPDENPTNNFTDAGNTYYTKYLAAAKRLGISNGVGNNLFSPNKEITRQEMFTLLYNALNVIGEVPEATIGKQLANFSDADQIAGWAEKAMELFVGSGIVSGSGDKLLPIEISNRAEMAQVLYNLLTKEII